MINFRKNSLTTMNFTYIIEKKVESAVFIMLLNHLRKRALSFMYRFFGWGYYYFSAGYFYFPTFTYKLLFLNES